MENRLSSLQRLVRDTARRFATQRLRACAKHRTHTVAVGELSQQFCDLGLNLVDVPTDVGGVQLGALSSALMHEALAAGDVNTTFAITQPGAFVALMARIGDAGARTRWLRDFVRVPHSTRGAVAVAPAGTLWARAEGTGWRLGGTLSGIWHLMAADRLAAVVDLVDGPATAAAAPSEISRAVFVLDGELLMRVRAAAVALDGLSHSQIGTLTFDDTLVSADCCVARGDLMPALGGLFAAESVRMASLALGTARAASSYVLAFAEERRQSGHPLAHFQSMGFLLIDIELACREALGRLTLAAGAAEEALSAQLMPERALERLDEDLQEAIEVARQRADEVAFFVTDSALQILDDGHVDVAQHPLLGWHKDVKLLARCYHWQSFVDATPQQQPVSLLC